MRRLFIELIAICAAATFALATLRLASSDENVASFIALIGSLAIWEAARFVLNRFVPRPNA